MSRTDFHVYGLSEMAGATVETLSLDNGTLYSIIFLGLRRPWCKKAQNDERIAVKEPCITA